MAELVPSGGACDGPKRSPQQLVSANDLIMRSIFDLVDAREDLLSGMLVCKDIASIPARLIHKSTTESELARVWSRGCSLNRFYLYVHGVKELTVKSGSPPINLEELLQRFELLDRIHVTAPLRNSADVKVEEIYLCGGRKVYVRGQTGPNELSLDRRVFPVEVNERVAWIGIQSLSESPAYVDRTRDARLLDLVSSAIRVGSTSLRELSKLEVSRIRFTLKVLDFVLTGCPKLKVLSCSLDTSASRGNLGPLRKIMWGPGAQLRQLDIQCYYHELLSYLRRLEGCPHLRISGAISCSSLLLVTPFSPPSAKGNRTEHLTLAPSMSMEWKETLADPYHVARQIRNYISPHCVVTIDTSGRSGEELLWLRILSSILRSLQSEEDLRRSKTKGWAKCDPPPQPN
ncbi:hypothetical protein HD553DRAFT_350527 [Filobasidium floriforme]|uniref:uncharacterized protein n=1 Tax=Filobasidium floriforme TaxID=5210 RepID=UPI001E8DCF63|nr:uncharacterized protein HD553DRAFT_350527 [Filobasidium floriforme]KAH8083542.1 hypothetical protein HD553DRAFT_350527 [Filobasidium floriforme]